ncbi:hypothetical protein ROE7235_01379 [Roseibaca ekhonensis]|jgi:hypothetical protein|uniref:Uncharacterized protein n=1 Tax=Roseinatronobacter ekhonensis TaxID=254356 RepID=A0A3B0MPS0_9RHOB|nr:hypothetical protein [Roseibaca ekhonensis]SUZ31629.1 hypothetical protein ROE7235_01379 [Roseibaca ekhonensis]
MRDSTADTLLMGLWTDETGAVTVDWVVLSAAALGVGLSAALTVGRGTATLGNRINASIPSVDLQSLGYSFLSLTDAQQAFVLGNLERRTDLQVAETALNMTTSFLAHMAAGDLESAAADIDRRHLNQTVLDQRGLDAAAGSLTVAEMQDLYAAAGGE